jgi:hypothetical protein
MFRRSLTLVCAVAVAHAIFFIWYQWPDHSRAWTDQGGYRQLGAVLARTGLFTRYPEAPVFVPEVIRTPGYPAFVAAIYRGFGEGNDLAVAIAQAGVFAGICLAVYALARRLMREPIAYGAAMGTALFSPLPYFGALVLTELFATFVLTLAMLLCVQAALSGRLQQYTTAGVLFGVTTLVRPGFVLLPFFLAIAMPVLVRAHRTRAHLRGWVVLAIAAGLTLVPWFTYNYVNLGSFTLSPAGGIGRGLWEGTWQGRWPGRAQAELTAIAAEPIDDVELDRRVATVAARYDENPRPMLAYTREWRAIRNIWETPTDPMERAQSRMVADREYLRAALAHIREDPFGHVERRLTRGLFVLWAAEIPIRYTEINSVPVNVIRLLWALQVVLLGAATVGVVALTRDGHDVGAMLIALACLYVTGVHVPLLCEARQSLPVKPLVIVAAAYGVATLAHRLLSGKSQVHEREHVL